MVRSGSFRYERSAYSSDTSFGESGRDDSRLSCKALNVKPGEALGILRTGSLTALTKIYISRMRLSNDQVGSVSIPFEFSLPGLFSFRPLSLLALSSRPEPLHSAPAGHTSATPIFVSGYRH